MLILVEMERRVAVYTYLHLKITDIKMPEWGEFTEKLSKGAKSFIIIWDLSDDLKKGKSRLNKVLGNFELIVVNCNTVHTFISGMRKSSIDHCLIEVQRRQVLLLQG